MEQYIHTLIAPDHAFLPHAMQVTQFFELLTSGYHFREISDSRFQHGLRVMKPSGSFLTGINRMTGETLLIPKQDQVHIERIDDIADAIEDLDSYEVRISGEWMPEWRPFVLFTVDRVPFTGPYLCEVNCHIHSELVSTSCWEKSLSPNGPSVPGFGEPCDANRRTGVFSHPWTGKLIQVPDAGCARFWIEFEFGRFLRPEIGDNLNVFNPKMIASIGECFGTKFVQGWRYY